MNTQLRRRLLLLGLLVSIFPSAARAQEGTRYYRYELLTRSQEAAYVMDVAAGASGRHHAVEVDAQGRVTRTAVIRDGQRISERVYSLPSDGTAANEYVTFTGSEKTGRVAVQRNAAGDRTREDYFTVSGASTGYTLYSYTADSVEATSYTVDGKRRSVNVSFYSPKGVLIRALTYSNPDDRGFHVDSEFDERTGLRKGSTQFESGSLSNSGLFDYDDDGDLVRQAAGLPRRSL
jgi:hypothetical protein